MQRFSSKRSCCAFQRFCIRSDSSRKSGDRSSGFTFQSDIFIPGGLIAIGGDRPFLKPVSARVSADIFGSAEKARAPCRVAIGFASHAEASRVCDRVKKYCRKSSRRPLPKRIRKLRDVDVRRSRIYFRRMRLYGRERAIFQTVDRICAVALIADDRRGKKRNGNDDDRHQSFSTRAVTSQERVSRD